MRKVAAVGLGFLFVFFAFGSCMERSSQQRKTVSQIQEPQDKENKDKIKPEKEDPSSTDKFNQALKRGMESLSAADFKKAQDAFVEALGIKGYSGPKDKAEDGLRIAKIGLGNEPAARATVEKWVKNLDDQKLDQAAKGELAPTEGYPIPDAKEL